MKSSPLSLQFIFPTEKNPLGIVWQAPQTDMELHSHTFHELVLVFKGESEHHIGTQCYKISAGDIFLIKPDLPHGYLKSSKDFELVNILYYPEKLNLPLYDLKELPGYHAIFEFEPAMREQHAFKGKLTLPSMELEQLRTLAMTIGTELLTNKSGQLFLCTSLFMQIILIISRAYDGRRNDVQTDLYKLGMVLSLIQTRFKSQLKITELAKKASMSQSGFYRSFCNALGISPSEYIQNLRLEHAKKMLIETQEPISIIALESGFEDSNYFSRVFRLNCGMTPREYRSKIIR